MAAAVPGIQSLRSGPVLLLKALERLVVLRVDAEVLLFCCFMASISNACRCNIRSCSLPLYASNARVILTLSSLFLPILSCT